MVTPDDLESQHRLQWLSKLKNTLGAHQEIKEENQCDFCILKVPESCRQPPEQYTPSAWRFGLHNRENLDTNGSEALEISLANAFELVGDKLDEFCTAIVDDPKKMLQYYGLQEEGAHWSDDVIKYVLTLDALFLALHFDQYVRSGRHLWTTKQMTLVKNDIVYCSKLNCWKELLGHDIFKYESQIPFELIERAYKYLRKYAFQSAGMRHVPSDETVAESYGHWEKKWKAIVVNSAIFCFMDLNFDYVKYEYPFALTDNKHILGLAHEAICGEEGMQRTFSRALIEYIHIQSATELIASGIKIKGLAQEPLCRMSYDDSSSCLSLPTMKMADSVHSKLGKV